ncbi:MAG: hypothetical protein WC855_11085 [Thermodesulfovibrionales bacterium]
MIKSILTASASDHRLSAILEEAKEFAQVYYVPAKQRQKGCDGMGELATMKGEFRDVVDKMIQYSQEKKYISQDVSYDIDSIADEIVKGILK